MILQKILPEYSDRKAAELLGRHDPEAKRLVEESLRRHPLITEKQFWEEHLKRSSGKAS